MRSIFDYYQEELSYLDLTGKIFSKNHPEVASRIGLDNQKDPHIKRLVESFAFLSARLHLEADAQFSTLIQSLLWALYPHFLHPLPSMSIVQFENVKSKGFVPRHTPLFAQAKELCTFRTLYPLHLAPVVIQNVSIVSKHDYTLHTSVEDRFFDFPPYFLRIVLEGECEELTFHIQGALSLYKTLLFYKRALITTDQKNAHLLPEEIHPLGFTREEGAFPAQSVHAYALLQEFFHFPEKFMFFSLKIPPQKGAFELLLPLEEECSLTPDTLLLNCTPIVNLFSKTTEPIALNHQKTFYPLVPDARKKMDIYDLEAVYGIFDKITTEIPAYFEGDQELLWLGNRQEKGFYIALIDKALHAREEGVLYAKALCMNGTIPQDIVRNTSFDIEIPIQAIPVCIKRPIAPHYPKIDSQYLWNLLAILTSQNINVQDLLKIFDYPKEIPFEIKDKVRRIGNEAWRGFVKGHEITLHTNDFLLGQVLRCCLELKADINRFIDVKVV